MSKGLLPAKAISSAQVGAQQLMLLIFAPRFDSCMRSHIGIQRDSKNSTLATIEENLKKSRRALYSLMESGLHGENGLDPATAISILRTYVIPIMLYGLFIDSCRSAICHSVDSFPDLHILPNRLIALLCISASAGIKPDII
jgi:hypothetical protein